MVSTKKDANKFENKDYIDNEIKKLSSQIEEIKINSNKKEDDLKNIINQKDIIINEMNNIL